MKTACVAFLTLLVWSEPVILSHFVSRVRSGPRTGRFNFQSDQFGARWMLHFPVDTGPEIQLCHSLRDPWKRVQSLRVVIGASLALLSRMRRVGKSGERYYVRYFDNQHFNFGSAA